MTYNPSTVDILLVDEADQPEVAYRADFDLNVFCRISVVTLSQDELQQARREYTRLGMTQSDIDALERFM